MGEFDPASFYENYKKLYAKAAELSPKIEEAEEVCAAIYDGFRCLCGGEDCKYANLGRAESQLRSLVIERANLIRNMESVIREYKAALEVSYLEQELKKELQDLAEFKFALKAKELEPASQPEINVVQKPQSH